METFTASQNHLKQHADLSQLTGPQSHRARSLFIAVKDTTPTVYLVAGSPVSTRFLAAFKRALGKVPPALCEHVSNQGYAIVLAPTLTEANQRLKNSETRRHRTGRSWNSTFGYHDAALKRLSFAEYHRDYDQLGAPYVASAVSLRASRGSWRKVITHEFGHALDCTNGEGMQRYSYSKEFRAAYLRDVEPMDELDRSALGYFLQGSESDARIKRGVRETFADVLAALWGPGGMINPEFMLMKFANTAEWIKENVPSIKHRAK